MAQKFVAAASAETILSVGAKAAVVRAEAFVVPGVDTAPVDRAQAVAVADAESQKNKKIDSILTRFIEDQKLIFDFEVLITKPVPDVIISE